VRGLSIYHPAHLGTDQNGHRVTVPLMYSNMLLAGVPGSGKSVALNNIVAHTALCTDAELFLIDGKLVELLPWARPPRPANPARRPDRNGLPLRPARPVRATQDHQR
jgi:hypothetical protein